jgi:hypothetical protein
LLYIKFLSYDKYFTSVCGGGGGGSNGGDDGDSSCSHAPVPSVYSFRTEINKTGYVNIRINLTLTSVCVTIVAVEKQ